MVFGEMSVMDSVLVHWSVSWDSRVDFKRKHNQDYDTHIQANKHTHTHIC